MDLRNLTIGSQELINLAEEVKLGQLEILWALGSFSFELDQADTFEEILFLIQKTRYWMNDQEAIRAFTKLRLASLTFGESKKFLDLFQEVVDKPDEEFSALRDQVISDLVERARTLEEYRFIYSNFKLEKESVPENELLSKYNFVLRKRIKTAGTEEEIIKLLHETPESLEIRSEIIGKFLMIRGQEDLLLVDLHRTELSRHLSDHEKKQAIEKACSNLSLDEILSFMNKLERGSYLLGFLSMIHTRRLIDKIKLTQDLDEVLDLWQELRDSSEFRDEGREQVLGKIIVLADTLEKILKVRGVISSGLYPKELDLRLQQFLKDKVLEISNFQELSAFFEANRSLVDSGTRDKLLDRFLDLATCRDEVEIVKKNIIQKTNLHRKAVLAIINFYDKEEESLALLR